MKKKVKQSVLIPLKKFLKMQSNAETSEIQSNTNGNGTDGKVEMRADANLNQAKSYKKEMKSIANDPSLTDDERSQKYLSAIRNYILFRDKDENARNQPRFVRLVKNGKIDDDGGKLVEVSEHPKTVLYN